MSLIDLQKKIGAKPDGVFGKETFTLASEYFKLTNIRAIHFFSQVAHETENFKFFTENLNYSAKRLLQVFPKFFTIETANKYAMKPQMIANRVYANRMGNGDEESGDGWKHIGRGALHTTGKEGYCNFAKYVKDSEIMKQPELLATKYSFESAIFFFNTRKLWTICDKGVDMKTIRELSFRINGGYNGIKRRTEITNTFYLKYKV